MITRPRVFVALVLAFGFWNSACFGQADGTIQKTTEIPFNVCTPYEDPGPGPTGLYGTDDDDDGGAPAAPDPLRRFRMANAYLAIDNAYIELDCWASAMELSQNITILSMEVLEESEFAYWEEANNIDGGRWVFNIASVEISWVHND